MKTSKTTKSNRTPKSMFYIAEISKKAEESGIIEISSTEKYLKERRTIRKGNK